jgi:hypothetical protein
LKKGLSWALVGLSLWGIACDDDRSPNSKAPREVVEETTGLLRKAGATQHEAECIVSNYISDELRERFPKDRIWFFGSEDILSAGQWCAEPERLRELEQRFAKLFFID